MSRVRTRDTEPELLLRKTLWATGMRGWRLHANDLPGKPDLVWRSKKLAVFVDGAFWHGHPDYYRDQSGAFWNEKIASNRARDERVNRELEGTGWKIIRLWDFEVERDPIECVRRLAVALADS